MVVWNGFCLKIKGARDEFSRTQAPLAECEIRIGRSVNQISEHLGKKFYVEVTKSSCMSFYRYGLTLQEATVYPRLVNALRIVFLRRVG